MKHENAQKISSKISPNFSPNSSPRISPGQKNLSPQFRSGEFQETQLFKNTVSKTHLFNHVKKDTLFQKKVSFLLFCFFFFAISAETPIFIVFPALHCFGPKKFGQTDSVHENARFFSLPDPNSVRQFLQKNPFFGIFSHFWMTTLKNPSFIGFFGLFHFLFFFLFFWFLFLQHKKEKTKMQFSFRKPHF